MKVQSGWDICRYLVVVLAIVGIVTASLNTAVSGFTPISWFLLALILLLIITCHEVLMIRTHLENKNSGRIKEN